MAETIAARPTATTPEIVTLVERPAAVVLVDATREEFPKKIGEAFALSARVIAVSGAVIAGHPFARYLGFGERIRAEVGFPYAGTLVPTEAARIALLPGGRAVTTTHVGSYDELAGAWDGASAWMKERGLECAGPPWEAYATGPDEPGPPVTQIFWPIR
jgi:effector-binding domain-containing protein